MSLKILISWIGMADIKASEGVQQAGLGPVGQAITTLLFDRIVLLNDFDQITGSKYVDWVWPER